MPHFLIDHSPNLADRLSMPDLLDHIRRAAIDTGVFPLAGIRVRAVAVDCVTMADGNPDHAYLDIIARIGEGRDPETRQRALAEIFAAVELFCRPVMETTSLMLSMELREIPAAMSLKSSSIRRHLPKEPT